MIQLDQATAVVTGAGSGIGLASARRLYNEGAKLILNDVNQAALTQIADELDAEVVCGDVGDLATWQEIKNALNNCERPLGVVHLNAGIAPVAGDIDNITYESYHKTISTNINGVFYGIKELKDLLAIGAKSLNEAVIVVTASMASLIGFSLSPVYTLTKHAVAGLVRSLEQPLRPRSIRINAICPSFVDTPLLGEEAKEGLKNLGFEMLKPEDIADAVMFCLNSDFSGQCVICQIGLPPTIYQYRGVPGPRGQQEIAGNF